MDKKRFSGVLVKYNDKVLLCKRNTDNTFPGMWSIPCGGIKKGENTREAAKREFFEETNLNINNFNLNFIGILPRLSRDGKKTKGLMYVYMIEVDNMLEPNFELALDGDEHSEWGYFDKKEINNIDMGKHLHHLLKLFLNN